MSKVNFKFENGERVTDKITGFTGIVTSRVEYINGCIQYCVTPKINEDGKMSNGEYIDEGQLEITTPELERSKSGPPHIGVDTDRPGGPQRDCPMH